ncbi:MAG: Protein of unknown function transrane [Firmicutes bacterium]|nr:Protein of unknown function transrane [Bacillota bacterium]
MEIFDLNTWQVILNFKTIFLGIIIEALPFILISVIVSSVLHNFVSEELIQRVLPKDKMASIVLSCLLGMIFPACDCGMVPIVRRLVKKGVPLYCAVAFMLSAPIINPVVATATAYAFNSIGMAVARLGIAFLVAYITSALVSEAFSGTELKGVQATHDHGHDHNHDHDDHACGCGCHHAHTEHKATLSEKFLAVLEGACSEFFEMGKYLIIGAFLGAVAQTLVPRATLLNVGHEPFFSIIVMMFFAFSISVCSTADAFIAASFNTSFTTGALVAFMVFGPMIDIKNILMLSHAFRLRFVVFLVTIVSLLCALGTYVFINL